MTPEFAIDLVQRALRITVTIGGPALLTALVVGLVVSLVQAVTQIQEQTLTFIPKLIALGLVLWLLLPWMCRVLIEFTTTVLRGLPGMAG